MGKKGLYVLTGFLGAGKTTFLKKVLEKNQFKAGVIQNEFGKVSIDGEILSDEKVRMVEINRGSIFCSCLKLSFVEALAEIAKEELDFVFVESSGWGDPSNMKEILQAVEMNAPGVFDFLGTICLIDGNNFVDQLDNSGLETIERQLKHCHLAVVTKADLLSETEMTAVLDRVRKVNPKCQVTISRMGETDYDFMQTDLLQYQWSDGEETTNSEETKPKTIVMKYSKAKSTQELLNYLNVVKKDTYRIKGFFQLSELGMCQVDVVGKKVDIKPVTENAREDHDSELVFISKIGPQIIKVLFQTWEEMFEDQMELKN